MTWDSGSRELKKFDSKEDSYEDFKRIWSGSYKTFPTYEMAVKWTGNDHPDIWLKNVTYYYNQ